MDALSILIEELRAMLAEFSPGMSLEDVQAEYQDKLYEYMADYLQSSRSVVVDRNKFGRAVNDGFTFAFVAGWSDAGASALNDEAQAWLNGRISEELTFMTSLFSQLKALREDDTIPLEDKLTAAQAHAEAYTNTLTGVYAQAKMMGDPEQDGTWELGATEEHCDTCAKLNGQTHPLSWFLKNGYIPQEAGSKTLDCGGWRCDCKIKSKKTGKQLIP